jgi:hypothetical protein
MLINQFMVPAGAARKHFSVASLLERTEFHLEV